VLRFRLSVFRFQRAENATPLGLSRCTLKTEDFYIPNARANSACCSSRWLLAEPVAGLVAAGR
jgi:hypothetical protein